VLGDLLLKYTWHLLFLERFILKHKRLSGIKNFNRVSVKNMLTSMFRNVKNENVDEIIWISPFSGYENIPFVTCRSTTFVSHTRRVKSFPSLSVFFRF
jgi:hypothetical protein